MDSFFKKEDLDEYFRGILTYTGSTKSFILEDLFDWNYFSQSIVKDVLISETDITITTENNEIYVSWNGCDMRKMENLNIEKCLRQPEGCCFEHSGCDNKLCNEHYPLQKITLEFDRNKILNHKIMGFYHNDEYEYHSYSHEFYFLLDNEDKIQFTLNNTPDYYDLELLINVSY